MVEAIYVRKLTQTDYATFDNFLKQYADTSMFMRSNAAKNGLDWKPEPYHGHFFGAFMQDDLRGVLVLNWNGNIMSQAPDKTVLRALFETAKAHHPDHQVKGLLAPNDQAQTILGWLDIPANNFSMSEIEETYELPIAEMKLPKQLADGTWQCRRATVDDIDLLAQWNGEYDIEALGADPLKPGFNDVMRKEVEEHVGNGTCYVLMVDGQIVSKTNFNSVLNDTVQIGGVYTPPHLRGKSYARAVVAGALKIAESEGRKNALLFTKNPPAVRAYKALGFDYRNDYHLTLLKNGHPLG